MYQLAGTSDIAPGFPPQSGIRRASRFISVEPFHIQYTEIHLIETRGSRANKLESTDVTVVLVDTLKVAVGCVSDVATELAIGVSKVGDLAASAGPGIPVAKECVVCIGCNL